MPTSPGRRRWWRARRPSWPRRAFPPADSCRRFRLERAMTAFPAADGRLTPDAIRSYAFPSARFGRRGLDEGHVWEFCRLAEREVVRLLNERTSLADEVQRLRRRVLAGPAAGSGVRPDDGHAEAVAILSRAQQAADRYVADAQEYCR